MTGPADTHTAGRRPFAPAIKLVADTREKEEEEAAGAQKALAGVSGPSFCLRFIDSLSLWNLFVLGLVAGRSENGSK